LYPLYTTSTLPFSLTPFPLSLLQLAAQYASATAVPAAAAATATATGVVGGLVLVVLVVAVGLCACGGLKKTMAPLLSPGQPPKSADSTLYVINVDAAAPPPKPEVSERLTRRKSLDFEGNFSHR
jgi:hypothetical protein